METRVLLFYLILAVWFLIGWPAAKHFFEKCELYNNATTANRDLAAKQRDRSFYLLLAVAGMGIIAMIAIVFVI